jgi:hypothetical protein
VLGALVKKAGLDLMLNRADAERQPNDGDAMPLRRGIDSQSTTYDRALILGALVWLASAMHQPASGTITVPDRQKLRESGHQALKPNCQ